MTEKVKTEKKSRLSRIVMTVLTWVFIIVVTTQVALWGAFWWLNTDAGQRFLSARLADATAGRGVTIAARGFRVPALDTFRIGHVVVTLADGQTVTVEQLRLRIAFSGVFVGRPAFSLTAETVTLAQGAPPAVIDAPAPVNATDDPFVMPDLPFSHLRARIAVDRVVSGDTVFAPDVTLTVGVAGTRISFDVYGRARGGVAIDSLLKGVVDTSDMSFDVSRVFVTAADFEIDGTLAGNRDAAAAKFRIYVDAAQAGGFAPVDMTVKARDLTGNMTADIAAVSAFDTTPVNFAAEVSARGVSGLSLSADGVTIGGTVLRADDAGVFKGDITADFNLMSWLHLLPPDMAGAGTLRMHFDAEEEKQKITLHFSGGEVQYGGASLQKLDMRCLACGGGDMPRVLFSGRAGFGGQSFAFDNATDIGGDNHAPRIKGKLTLTPDKRGSAPVMTFAADYLYADGIFDSKVTGTAPAVRRLTAALRVPVDVTFAPVAVTTADPLIVALDIDSDMDVAALARSFLPPDIHVSGDLRGHVKISGRADAPDIDADIAFAKGAYHDTSLGIALDNIAAQAAYRDGALVLDRFTATDSDTGTVSGTAHLRPLERNLPVTAAIAVKNLDPFRNSSMAKGNISAEMKVSGHAGAYLVSGTITPARIDIQIPERFSSSVPQLNIVPPEDAGRRWLSVLETVKLDMTLAAEHQVFVRGWGLDAEFGGRLNIGGTLAEPLLDGGFESIRGRYEEFDKRFTLNRGILRFQGAVPPSPYLDIVAETKTSDIVAQIELSGSVESPQIKLSSVPALPQDEVLARVLFGRGMSRLSPFQAMQLMRTLQRFSGQGGSGFDPLGILRGAFGLDDLQVEMNDDGDTTFGAGKYLTEKVYLQMQTGTGDKSGAAKIQIELTPNIKVESTVTQDSQTGGGVMWEWDY